MNKHSLHLLRPVLVLSALAAFAISYAMGLPGHTTRPYFTELAKVPEKDRSRSNPLAGDPDAVDAGRKLFEQHCAECHGSSAVGGRKGPSLRLEPVRTATEGSLFWVLTNGVVRRVMPVWSRLPEPQRWQIVSYLKSLN